MAVEPKVEVHMTAILQKHQGLQGTIYTFGSHLDPEQWLQWQGVTMQ